MSMVSITASGEGPDPVAPSASPVPLRMAVLGDSDSHAYQDRVHFPPGSPARGGSYRAVTLQWTELLARLRPQSIDLGAWGEVGMHPRTSRVAGWVGSTLRTPRKEDHLHNFAVSGARCDDLNAGRWRQSEFLIDLIREQPGAWRQAVVVIRIGINDLGDSEALDRLAANPGDPDMQRRVSNCTTAIGEAVRRLRAEAPTLRFVLVGIFNNAHWAKYLDRWRDPVPLRHIDQGLDPFDNALRALARPGSGILFFDERRLFAADWGGRDPQGQPAYRSREIVPGLVMTNTAGDHPSNLVVADGHMGTVWNGLWVNHLLDTLADGLNVHIPRLRPDELARVVNRP